MDSQSLNFVYAHSEGDELFLLRRLRKVALIKVAINQTQLWVPTLSELGAVFICQGVVAPTAATKAAKFRMTSNIPSTTLAFSWLQVQRRLVQMFRQD